MSNQRRIECPCCKSSPDIASISSYLYVHFCKATGVIFYTNGVLWALKRGEIVGVPRTIQSTPTHCQDGQIPCRVIPYKQKTQSQNRTGTASEAQND